MITNSEGKVKIVRSKTEIEGAIERLLQERSVIRIKLNNSAGAYRKDECEDKLELINRDRIIGDILYRIFDIQDYEFLDGYNEYCIDVEIN